MNKFYTTILALGITLTACTKPNDDELLIDTVEPFKLETLEVVKSPSTASKGASTSKTNDPYVVVNGVEYDMNLIETNSEDDGADEYVDIEDVFEVKITDEDGELTAWIKLRVGILGNTNTNEIESVFLVSYDKTQGQESYSDEMIYNPSGTFNNGNYNIDIEL